TPWTRGPLRPSSHTRRSGPSPRPRERREKGAHGGRSVRDAGLRLRSDLRQGAATERRHDKDRVVAKAGPAARRSGDLPLQQAFGREPIVAVGEDENTAKAGATVARVPQLVEKESAARPVVEAGAAEASGVDARRAAERVDFEAGIVGERGASDEAS